MKYKYLRDPLFLFCVVLYFVNRLLLKPFWSCDFVHGYFNDLICIPFWLPIMLYMMRRLGLRDTDEPPAGCEIIISLVVWSFVFELVVPRLDAFQGLAYTDHIDILAYTLGTLLATIYWRTWYRERRNQPQSAEG